jgi:RNA polymerase sigma-70 factor, ECF subfamily
MTRHGGSALATPRRCGAEGIEGICGPSNCSAIGLSHRPGSSFDADPVASGRVLQVGCAGSGSDCRPGGRVVDPESAAWVRGLRVDDSAHNETVGRLHDMLLRVARSEVGRRRGRFPAGGEELEDVAYQAAADAVVAVLARIDQFRGESRFTTWACKFAIFEVSSKLNRHFWRRPTTPIDIEDWDRLPDRFGLDPARIAEWRDVVAALRRAVDEELTAHQRRIFVAIVLDGQPLDALVAELGSSRNAIYKTLFDARRKLRTFLATHGYLGEERHGRQ